MSLLEHSPKFTVEQAAEIVKREFGIEVSGCVPLESERDQNFRIDSAGERSFVLKIANALEDRYFLEGQNALLKHVEQSLAWTPTVHSSNLGEQIVTAPGKQRDHFVRLLDFVPGKVLADQAYLSDDLLVDLGYRVAQLDATLIDFDHPAFHREFHWDLALGDSEVQKRLHLIKDDSASGIAALLSSYQLHTKPHTDQLPTSVIHNDANDANVIVSPSQMGPFANQVTGIIDFGDVVHSWTVNGLAIAIAYTVLKCQDPLHTANCVLRGYQRVRPLNEAELTCLFGLICMRLCVSAAIAAEQILAQPDNQYLWVSQQPIRRTLPKLLAISFPFAERNFRNVAGLPVCEHAARVQDWLRNNQSSFAFPVNPVLPGQRPPAERILVMDLSVASPDLPVNVDAITEPEISELVFDARDKANADVVIGRYLEPRVLYSSEHFVGNDLSEENRTIHLGIDIFAEAGTDVVAVLDGTVHFAGSIDRPLDYGGLVILAHQTDDGDSFFSLYGHLDPASLASLKPGESISVGQKFAELGTPAVNVGWTPHVHLQLMLDLLDLQQFFPGVAFSSQQNVWSQLSPDPNLLLGIPADCFPKPTPDFERTWQHRQRLLGPSLSLSYRQPLKIVRGWKQFLFNDAGRRFLDAYNNVPHVGHCHPQIVQAIVRQARLLNTNTRYLHDTIHQLSERLIATLPDSLQVCYFVNSASEANELAIRMARTFTNAKDMLVTEAAYHGHSTTLIEASPYKHDGPGGQGAGDWVHSVELADVYRGTFNDSSTAGALYAERVKQTIQSIDRKLCGFLFECCPSVGGQIIFPKDYLKLACQYVRQAGGLCLADDVQTGYGRLGSHMYGFQLNEIEPDILILGKPMGNGQPLAAVITTREIAEAFDNGMEFFSTFGGNPVSCAAGLAVLDVLESESLQPNALQVGEVLLQGLHQLKDEFDLIGDVRGRGFFLGVELVQDPSSKVPATELASFIANRMRQLGILLGTDGPHNNVLKIRPPMCFNKKDAEQLLTQIRKVLQEI